MCKLRTEEFYKLNPALEGFMRGGSPSVTDTVIRRVERLYDMLPPGGQIELTITQEDETYVQLRHPEGTTLLTEHFHQVFAFGREKGNPEQVALLDLIDTMMGNVSEREREMFETAKEKVKSSTAFCLALTFTK